VAHVLVELCRENAVPIMDQEPVRVVSRQGVIVMTPFCSLSYILLADYRCRQT
jgi:hypothetical protein